MQIFGANERDVNNLRIVSLYDVDLDKLNTMVTALLATPDHHCLRRAALLIFIVATEYQFLTIAC